jgi:hypothetical protein
MIILRFNSKRQQRIFWVVMFGTIGISTIAGFFDKTAIGKAIQHMGFYASVFWLIFGAPFVRTLKENTTPKE